MKSYKLCHYAVALGKHTKHSKTRLCEASLASCQTQKPFPAISGTLHSRDNQNISRLTRKPSTIMVVKIPHCVISRNIQQSTHHRDCKTKPFLLMQPCPNAHLCRPKKDRAQRMQASKHTWRWKHVKAVRLCHAIHTTRRYALEGSHVFLCWRLTDPLWSSEIHIADKQEISKTICRPSTIMVVKIPHCELRANIQQVLIIGTAGESISYGWHWELCTHVVMLSQTQPSVQLEKDHEKL